MGSKKYTKLNTKQKIKAITMVLTGTSQREVAKKYGVSKAVIAHWIANPEINPNKEIALQYRKEHPWLENNMNKKYKKKDPFSEEIPVTTTSNPEDLAKENRDLRRKLSYLEDKVLYLETLYEAISIKPSEVSKKKDLKQL